MSIISKVIITMNIIMGISFIYQIVSRNKLAKVSGINEKTLEILNYKKSLSIIYALLFIILSVLLTWSMGL